MKRSWLVLHYQLPREPSAPRVSTWRKLKKLGAVLVNETFWVLPENNRTREQFRWLAASILEYDGQVSVFSGSSLMVGQDETLEQLFLEKIEPAYRDILRALEPSDPFVEPDLLALSRQFQTVLLQDHLKSALGKQVKAALEQARGNA
jgi:hypothetical protein